MRRDIDDQWIEDAVERYRRIDDLLARFRQVAETTEVSVRSPDGTVEVLVTADGVIRDVRIEGPDHGRTGAELSRSVREAVTAAQDAAAWARRKLHSELFSDYPALS